MKNLLTRLRAWYAGLPDPVKAAAATAVQVFAVAFLPAVFGWTNDAIDWAADLGNPAGPSVPFPDPSTLTRALVAGLAAAATFLVTLAYRGAQALGLLPGAPPTYGSP